MRPPDHTWLAHRCRAVWSETAHPDHPELTVADMLEIERDHLMPMPEPFDGYVEASSRVSSTCLVRVARNRYSVPCEWANKSVSTRLYPNQIVVVAGDAIVARHDRLSGQGKTVLNKLTKSEKEGWEWLTSKGMTKSGEYAQGMKLPYRTAMNHLKKFRDLGLLESTGSARATEYKVRKP